MPRRYSAELRVIEPDLRYNSVHIQMLINRLMRNGKKSVATSIIYDCLETVEARTKRPGLEVFEEAVKNAMPQIEVRPRRVGGATYQVPVEVSGSRQVTLALRWILSASRSRSGKSMSLKLAGELMDAATGQGAAVKRRDDTHRMAEANRAFAHFRF